MQGTPVVEKQYQLILWMLPKMAKFPKDQRFLLADRIERLLLDILEMLIAAVYTKRRSSLLMKVNMKLNVLRYLMRIACDMHYVNMNGYEYFSNSALEIGQMTGGWLKVARTRGENIDANDDSESET